MPESVVRISQGFFEPELLDRVSAKLEDGRATLEPALRALPGLLHYYVAVDPASHSMVNVSVWESLAAAQQMDALREMLAQRDVFVGLGVKFQPIRNYSGLWSIGKMTLVWPSPEYLPSYVAALERGWSPDNVRGQAAAQEELARIAADAHAFLASLVDREAAGDPIVLPDGTNVPRLPGYRRWMWDGEFCGSIGFRWQRGTDALPPHCLGHIGYGVVPWKRGRGYATRALGEMLREARAEGLRYVELTTQPDNVPSQRVITANGGLLVEEFVTPPALGGRRELRYRVHVDGGA